MNPSSSLLNGYFLSACEIIGGIYKFTGHVSMTMWKLKVIKRNSQESPQCERKFPLLKIAVDFYHKKMVFLHFYIKIMDKKFVIKL